MEKKTRQLSSKVTTRVWLFIKCETIYNFKIDKNK